jgi:hypothetical protein
MGASITDHNGSTIAIEAAHVQWHFLLSSRATVFVAGAKQNAIAHEFERAPELRNRSRDEPGSVLAKKINTTYLRSSAQHAW